MKRRGFTLVEMVAVVTIGTALMGVSVVMLYALLKSEGSSRRHLEYCTIVNRLDDQFRDDAHAAASADAGGGGLEFELPGPDMRRIRYLRQPADEGGAGKREIVREEFEGSKVLRRDSFALPDAVRAEFDAAEGGGLRTATCRLVPKPAADSKIHYPAVRIDAVLGRDRRFEHK